MKFLSSLIWLICFALAGCRAALVPMPNGKVAFVGSLLTDPHWSHAEIRPDGTFVLDGYNSKVNAQAVGTVAGAIVKSVLALP